ncbi:hypothetical protein BP354E_5543 [Burkholderia pseudomallei 354e]|uniref:Uncharacterized protein n=1 Tax=Burkholderia pseudomallei (strain K96243) TaxID=272560 RepID=Q63NB7_BURPS|nr:hypothetical protein BP354E_5543 [Burkholderia pseudomallei 354e]EIF72147.1 hypothetical protein BP354A_6165 [Burkholderia pseudomallei 354a]OMR29193.1 hypothetical protein AQ720_02275 [Burkholderia pseudomallei]CAH37830.1 hypothetical protein BPSS0380B [Burkholderia pseudomallei K96243]OMR63318.1 hypothetical protein AQ727_28810 [Burkholderia pseudomallei]
MALRPPRYSAQARSKSGGRQEVPLPRNTVIRYQGRHGVAAGEHLAGLWVVIATISLSLGFNSPYIVYYARHCADRKCNHPRSNSKVVRGLKMVKEAAAIGRTRRTARA